MNQLPQDSAYFIKHLLELGRRVRTAVASARAPASATTESLAQVARQSAADTIYELDNHIDPVLEEFCEAWSREYPLVLIAEGIADRHSGIEGMKCFPAGTSSSAAAFRLIVDPIDGTRGLMYDKRSGWLLTGVAANQGAATRLSDIQAAVQVEIPTSKQNRSDVLWAVRGKGAAAIREDLNYSCATSLALHPTRATTLAHGFASVTSFFPGTKVLAAELMEAIARQCGGGTEPDRPLIFDDQYISTGGQLYEIIIGHDRFVADVRPHFYRLNGWSSGLAAHAYDLSTMLIAQEAGVILTNGLGAPVDGPLDITSAVAWVAYANEALRSLIEPVLRRFFIEHGLSHA